MSKSITQDMAYRQSLISVERVKDADIVVFVGGVSPNLEGEEMGVELPGLDRKSVV